MLYSNDELFGRVEKYREIGVAQVVEEDTISTVVNLVQRDSGPAVRNAKFTNQGLIISNSLVVEI